MRRGLLLNALGRKEGAIVDLERALESNPRCTQAYWYLGEFLRARGLYDESVRILAKLIEIQPDVGANYWARGQSFSAKGQRENAVRDFQEACRRGFQPAGYKKLRPRDPNRRDAR